MLIKNNLKNTKSEFYRSERITLEVKHEKHQFILPVKVVTHPASNFLSNPAKENILSTLAEKKNNLSTPCSKNKLQFFFFFFY